VLERARDVATANIPSRPPPREANGGSCRSSRTCFADREPRPRENGELERARNGGSRECARAAAATRSKGWVLSELSPLASPTASRADERTRSWSTRTAASASDAGSRCVGSEAKGGSCRKCRHLLRRPRAVPTRTALHAPETRSEPVSMLTLWFVRDWASTSHVSSNVSHREPRRRGRRLWPEATIGTCQHADAAVRVKSGHRLRTCCPAELLPRQGRVMRSAVVSLGRDDSSPTRERSRGPRNPRSRR
jgi:hypothetical protein